LKRRTDYRTAIRRVKNQALHTPLVQSGDEEKIAPGGFCTLTTPAFTELSPRLHNGKRQ
jgi:hypothetical protein